MKKIYAQILQRMVAEYIVICAALRRDRQMM
jgi:hypothetical protein